MQDLKYWQDKIKSKRKNTNFRDFLKEIVSWYSFVLYKNSGLISSFPETERMKKVIDFNTFDENADSLILNGKEYDNKNTFFQNYKKLSDSIDYFNLVSYGGNDNSDFSFMAYNSKSIYLSSAVINNCENVLYSLSVKDNSTNILNGISVRNNCENIYFSVGIVSSFKAFYSKFINNSNNIWFSHNLNGCSECLLCDNLENCSYYIKNKKYSKEEYLVEKEKILSDKKSFFQHYNNLPNVGNNINSQNVVGSSCFNSEDIENGFFVYNTKNGKNIIIVGGVDGNKNMYDLFGGGAPHANDLYGVMGANGNNIYCSMNLVGSSHMMYSYNCKDCSYCLGCIGLKNKSYCIFNKQYTKEEWYQKTDEIFENMEKEGTLGDFFPGELNPFYFNDTVAGLIGGFTKEEVEKDGFMWRDEEIKVDIPEGSTVITTEDLDKYQGYNQNGELKINPEILKVVIKDEKGNYYRIVQMEYDFLVKHGLPIPEIHWMERMKLNFGI